jgi:urea transport system ATP-binding protein
MAISKQEVISVSAKDFARHLADHYIVMNRGEIVASDAGATMDQDGIREMIAV